MGDPWGPPKRKVTPISEWFSSWPAIAGQYINAEWIDGKPIYTQENFQVILQAMDSAGALHHLVNTSGEVTEASASNIATFMDYVWNADRGVNARPIWGNVPSANTVSTSQAIRPHLFNLPLTEAAGTIAATDVVPALAGYTAHCEVQGVWVPAGCTDAANTWTFSVAAGTLIGPPTFNMNLTAERYHNFSGGAAGIYGPAIPLRGTIAADDSKALQVAAANLANVGATYYISGVYWYET